MISLPNYLRAPFIAPGRRNRKVHWNRALAKAIERLGNFEREDWRRALWLPNSLRSFYPKWAKKNNPGCGCCEVGPTPCDLVADCFPGGFPDEVELTLPALSGSCEDCESLAGTYIIELGGADGLGYGAYLGSGFCGFNSEPTFRPLIGVIFFCDGNCFAQAFFELAASNLIQWGNGYFPKPVTIPYFNRSGTFAVSCDGPDPTDPAILDW